MEIINQIIKLGKRLEKQQHIGSLAVSVHQTDIDVLISLKQSGKPFKLKPGQLLDQVLITSGAMTAALNRLQSLDLIHREQDTKDGRVRFACLNEKGNQIAEEAITKKDIMAEQILDLFDDLEKRQLAQKLKKMILNLNKE